MSEKRLRTMLPGLAGGSLTDLPRDYVFAFPEIAYAWFAPRGSGETDGRYPELSRENFFLLACREAVRVEEPRPKDVERIRQFARALKISKELAAFCYQKAQEDMRFYKSPKVPKLDLSVIYEKVCLLAMADGRIEPREEKLLDSFADTLGVSPEDHRKTMERVQGIRRVDELDPITDDAGTSAAVPGEALGIGTRAASMEAHQVADLLPPVGTLETDEAAVSLDTAPPPAATGPVSLFRARTPEVSDPSGFRNDEPPGALSLERGFRVGMGLGLAGSGVSLLGWAMQRGLGAQGVGPSWALWLVTSLALAALCYTLGRGSDWEYVLDRESGQVVFRRELFGQIQESPAFGRDDVTGVRVLTEDYRGEAKSPEATDLLFMLAGRVRVRYHVVRCYVPHLLLKSGETLRTSLGGVDPNAVLKSADALAREFGVVVD